MNMGMQIRVCEEKSDKEAAVNGNWPLIKTWRGNRELKGLTYIKRGLLYSVKI